MTIAPLLGLAAAALLAGVIWYAWNHNHQLPLANTSSTSKRPATSSGSRTTIALASGKARRDTAGNTVLADAIVALDRRQQVSALLRQQAHLNDLQIFGKGVYRQQGRGEERQVKWELQTQVGDEPASLVQLVEDRFLWIDQRMPTERLVERVDLWRLRRLTGSGDAALQQVAPGQALAAGGWQSFGGLPMLLESLARNFDFSAPRQLQLGAEPVYALCGGWKPQRLRELLGVAAEETSVELPPRVPHDVLVLLGSRDYFPYLIEYRGGAEEGAQTDAYKLADRPLMRIEFYQVSLSAPIDPNEFVFTLPAGVDWIDATPRYIDRLQRVRAEQLAAAKEPGRIMTNDE